MTRKDHYQRAEELLAIAESLAGTIADLTHQNLPIDWIVGAHRGVVAAAQVHATLATAELFVAGA